MKEYSFLEIHNELFSEFYLLNCGMQKCKPSYSFGPAIRNHHILHYVISGKGYYYVKNKKYLIQKNQGFLILPDTLTFYHADIDDPWEYIWIGFDGSKVDLYLDYIHLNKDNLIFMSNESKELQGYVDSMINTSSHSCKSDLFMQGMLILFFSCIARSNEEYKNKNLNDSNIYISKAIEYIEQNYQNKVTVSDIAKYVSLNRTYLTAIFKNNLNLSPQNFIIKYKITKACELLVKTQLPVGEIALLCGYTDPLAFSKSFKNITGSTPTKYRSNKLKAYSVRLNDPYDEIKI